MGQATLDLPDPTLPGVNAEPLSPEALASADDLLSQLAGDDIDRLLAEADAERASAPVVAPPAPVLPTVAPTSVATPPAPAPADPIDAQTVSDAAATAEALTAAAIDAMLDPAIESTVDAVEAQAAPEPPPDSPAPSPAQPPAELPVDPSPAPVEASLDQPTFEPVDQKLLDEAAAQVASIMDPPAAIPEAAVAPAALADSAEREALSEPMILPEQKGGLSNWLWPLVKVLELINAPMNFFSDEVREGMGKVALVTTFNAAAVLVYVLLFRRGHH